MVRNLFTLFLLLMATVSCEAQFNENVWCFGDSAGINFNTTPPTPVKSNVKTRGACTSICDSKGDLLFYASNFNYDIWIQGASPLGQVFDGRHRLIKNGDSINSRSWYNELMIVNDPGDSLRFYLLHMGVTSGHFPGLYYSIVDQSADSGNGAVIQKNIRLDSLQNCDGMHAVKHANGRDWWLITRNWDNKNNSFYVYLISNSGLTLFNIQNIGTPVFSSFQKIKFNQAGDQVVVASAGGLLELFDFDRCTGQFINFEVIDAEVTGGPAPFYWGVEFSPSGEFLYVSSLGAPGGTTIDTSSKLMQFDLMATNILQSMIVLDTIEVPNFAGHLELGPDNKIYFANAYQGGNNTFFYEDTLTSSEVDYLGVINNPNQLGIACNFAPYSFYLGGERSMYGLPNNPNYHAGAMPGTVCDSLGLGYGEFGEAQFIVSLYPNPVNESASIVITALDNLNLNDLKFELYSSMGQLLLEKYVGSNRSIYFSREDLSSGSYFYRVYSRKHGVVAGKILIQ